MKNKQDYINYKLKKAGQAIKEARLLIENGMADTALSRMYYASFYAVNALLVSNDYNPKTHSGVKTLFNKEFVLTHKIDARFADYYSFIMAKRFEADYDDFVFVDENNIKQLLADTEAFVATVIALIEKQE
ncbi:MAG: HEPN domain-containing protein [Bacteroidota bacterium]|nr:HEPN domain-containing protein [Bacteroidota bacterium]